VIGEWASWLLGAVLVLSVLQDVFFTVLFPASGHGVLRRPLARVVWAGFRTVARRLDDDRRRGFLAYSGPVQISVNLGAWILLLTVGFALIYLPALGSQITASSGPTATTWSNAVYYSGYALTTLGVGDLVARDGVYRLLTVVEAGIGFATVSMAVTYFLSVYSALTQRKVTAAQLHHRTYDTGEAVELLAGLALDGELPGAGDELGRISTAIQHSLETHAAYPVLRYFHQRHVYYSLPRIVLLGLETVTIVRTVLDPGRYRHLIDSPSVAGLSASADQLLTELVPDAATGVPDPDTEQAWRERGQAAAERLAAAGLRVRDDRAAVADDYVALRAGWDGRLHSLADAMVYDWSTIEPDSRA
jgi:hypothetical protein